MSVKVPSCGEHRSDVTLANAQNAPSSRRIPSIRDNPATTTQAGAMCLSDLPEIASRLKLFEHRTISVTLTVEGGVVLSPSQNPSSVSNGTRNSLGPARPIGNAPRLDGSLAMTPPSGTR